MTRTYQPETLSYKDVIMNIAQSYYERVKGEESTIDILCEAYEQCVLFRYVDDKEIRGGKGTHRKKVGRLIVRVLWSLDFGQPEAVKFSFADGSTFECARENGEHIYRVGTTEAAPKGGALGRASLVRNSPSPC